MPVNVMPDWLASLEDEDVSFVKRFILASGSLKEIASQYGVTYPTVRLRLDRLIRKIAAADTAAADPFTALVKQLTLDDKLDLETARLLIAQHNKSKGESGCGSTLLPGTSSAQ